MSIDSHTLVSLRRIAEDEATQPKTRLSAIDAIASAQNFFGTMRFPIVAYVPQTERGRRWLRLALRKLLRAKRPMAARMKSSIHSRLLMLKEIQLDHNNKILRPPLLPDGTEMPIRQKVEQPVNQPVEPQPKQRPVDVHLEELRAIIATAERGNNAIN